MIDLRARQRFARFTTQVVVRRPRLWSLFRGPIARVFDTIAPDWDSSRVTPQHMAVLEAAFDVLERPPARVLDLGTGTGAAARAAAARWPDAQVTGVDVSTGMIREAQARAGSDRERYLIADAAALPFADGSFDLVTLLNMIPFFDELGRVAALGGTLVVAFSRGADTPIWVPLDRVRNELARRGFGDFREVTAGGGASLLAVRGAVS